ncbi:hypothetical protein K438DRAFT_1760893 [Mycena galopus ATCC 62051]|nr:hypothetical protein K438DRAFT_1760893 [Mycena galopus ATCC 62051]
MTQPKADFGSSWGGVATVYNSARVASKTREDLSGPDFMAIQMDSIVIYNAYILPETTNWAGNLERDPCAALAASIATTYAGRYQILLKEIPNQYQLEGISCSNFATITTSSSLADLNVLVWLELNSRRFKCKFVVNPNSASYLTDLVIVVDAPTASSLPPSSHPAARFLAAVATANGCLCFWLNGGQEQQRANPVGTAESLSVPVVSGYSTGQPSPASSATCTSLVASTIFPQEFTALTSWDATPSSWPLRTSTELEDKSITITIALKCIHEGRDYEFANVAKHSQVRVVNGFNEL